MIPTCIRQATAFRFRWFASHGPSFLRKQESRATIRVEDRILRFAQNDRDHDGDFGKALSRQWPVDLPLLRN